MQEAAAVEPHIVEHLSRAYEAHRLKHVLGLVHTVQFSLPSNVIGSLYNVDFGSNKNK